MKILSQVYNNALQVVDIMNPERSGKLQDGLSSADNRWCLGTHYRSKLEPGLSSIVVDNTYKEDMILDYKIQEEDSIGLYFYVTDRDIDVKWNNNKDIVGQLNYNLAIIDIGLLPKYIIQKGTEIYCICIFIKKELLKKYLNIGTFLDSGLEKIFHSQKNTIVHLDRMNNKSRNLINDFRKIAYDNPYYELFFKGLVYELISNFVQNLQTKKILEKKDINADIKDIVATKLTLLNMLEEHFPGIDFLANEVSMSVTKYKEVFAKVTGLSPGVFFAKNKLHLAKELLETTEYTIAEIVVKLKYYSSSYFAKCFKNEFGIHPKEYQSLF